MKNKIVGIILIFFFLSCQTDKTPLSIQNKKTKKTIQYTRTISGYVQMEHQTNHDNCAVFLDQVNIGTYTDSSGFYQLTLPDSVFENDTMKVNGTVQLYFYSFNYFLDSLQIVLGSKGIILDSLTLDADGMVENKLVKQQFSISLETDTTYYTPGDTVYMHMYLKKYSNNWIELEIPHSVTGWIGPVYFQYDNTDIYHLFADPITADASYVWDDSTLVIELVQYWEVHDWVFNNFPVGYYKLVPYMQKKANFIAKWWHIPENMNNFCPTL